MLRRSGCALLTVFCCALAAAPAPAQDPYTAQAWNILTPGQAGDFPPTAHSTDQLARYDGLTPLFGSVAASDLRRYFKPADFRLRDRESTERPRRGVTIRRDSYGVAHINGRTRADVAFGLGWSAGQDRQLLLEQARGPARVAAAYVPGVNAFQLVTQLRTVQPSAQAEAYLSRQVRLLRRTEKGRAVLRDIDAWNAGLNAYYRSADVNAAPWRRTDVIAVLAFMGSIFGQGGGQEVRSAQFLAGLQQRLGLEDGLAVFRDLRSAQDPEAFTSTVDTAPYDPVPSGPTPGSPGVDPDSQSLAARQHAAAAEAGQVRMSNALLVGPGRSASGNTLFVAGPQLGYFYPEIVGEAVLEGGGYKVRGIFAVGPFPLIGRGPDYAWSLTSAGSDNIDQFLEELCNPDGSEPTRESTHYRYRGQCRPMTTFDAGTVLASSTQPERRLVFNETVHGPVAGTVTVGGRPYAIANARTTRGREPLNLLFLSDMGRGKARTARKFTRIAGGFEYTFNWHYANDREIAFFSSGRVPLRAPGVDPSLPTLGTGEYDWRGFLSRRRHPQDVNPRSGLIVNWNNRPAPGFSSSDDNFTYGPVYRAELLKGFERRSRLHDVVSIMNRAATQDLRVVEVWPVIREVLDTGPAPDLLTAQAADLLDAWGLEGGSRLDRDLDGGIDHPGAAVLDGAWDRLADAVLGPVLGPQLDEFARIRNRDAHPRRVNGSAFDGGWYGYVDKDLRTLLGRSVRGPYSRGYCGGGDLTACREALWAALQQTAGELASAQGPDPSAWRSEAVTERIDFTIGLIDDTMRWVNRPTFQQAIEFDGHRRRR